MSELCIPTSTELTSRHSSWFNPYLMFRRGTLPFSELTPLIPAETWTLLDESEAAGPGRRALGEMLADHLYEIIPTLEPGDQPLRRLVLQARRDLHNDRPVTEAAASALKRVSNDSGRARFDQWRQLCAAEGELQAAARERLDAELRGARGRLAQVAMNENFLKGIQLSGSKLSNNIREYVAHVSRPEDETWSKRLRQTESTIIRYAYRMALRTSPFGTFTEIGAQPWRSNGEHVEMGDGARRHLVRLSRSLLVWMTTELRRIDGSENIFLLRLNNTLQVAGDHLEAFNRGMEGQRTAYWGEGFTNVRMVGPVAVLLDTLAGGPLSRAEVLERLVSRGMSAVRATTFLDQLVNAGVCHEGLGLPDQCTSYAREVALRLRDLSGPQAAQCASCFETLDSVETRFGPANIRQRDTLLNEINETVKRFSAVCGVEAPLEVGRTLIFEDIGTCRPAQSWDAEVLERNRPHFGRLLSLLPVFHPSTMEKLGMYRWFVSHFGEEGFCDDVLTLYRLFSEQSQEDVSTVLQALDDPDAACIRGLRQDLLRHLDLAVTDGGDAPTLTLNADCLDQLASSLPHFLPSWHEASFRVQLAPAGPQGRPCAVINDVTTGHGVFYSRFCDLVEPDDPAAWSLRRALSDTIARNSPGQADLTAVFGHNVNLHPRLAPKEVVYPGAVAAGPEGALTLRDIAVKADPVTHSLILIDRSDGSPLRLAPMNFLFPAAAPMLYRFLCVFSSLYTYRVGWWNRLYQLTGGRHLFLPRLTLGDLVLERRRWYVPVKEVHQLGDGSSADTLASLLATEQWRRARNLPRECFFQVEEKPEAIEGTGAERNWVEETRRWALTARNARRKRQYLDFRNPFLTRLLYKQASAIPRGEVLFQECLPPTAGYARPDGPQSAEEFLVEFHNEAGGEVAR